VPRLDLRATGDRPRILAEVVLSTTALQGGIRTRTCPQCGLNPTTTMAKRKFEYIPRWIYIATFVNLTIAAFVNVTILLIPLFLVLFFTSRRVVKGKLGLCADCDAADRRARMLQSASVGGLFAFPYLFAVGADALLGGIAGVHGLACGVISGIVGMFAALWFTRFDVLRCARIDKKAGTTTLKVSDSFAGVLAREAPGALRCPRRPPLSRAGGRRGNGAPSRRHP
jgi:hypothetical protein